MAAGMLTGLTATMMSDAVPVFADKKKCEHNDNNNCNDRHGRENKCKTENENEERSRKNDIENLVEPSNSAANSKDLLVLSRYKEGTSRV